MVRVTIQDLGYSPGQLKPGPKNSILDVPGVHVGQFTIGEDGDPVRKGVTIVLPRHPDDIYVPCYASLFTLNGNGEVTGEHQIHDWGYTNTPLALTNSCSLGVVYEGIFKWLFQRAKDKNLSRKDISHAYGTPIVGETADWILNDPFDSFLTEAHVKQAFANTLTQESVLEGQHGGGAGMTCHMFPAGTGTSSRIVTAGGPLGDPPNSGDTYTVGVILQSNYGHTHDLQIGGVPIGELLLKERGGKPFYTGQLEKIEGSENDGSIVIYCITDAPMLPHQLNRMARHCAIGLAQVGGHGVGRNHSGDIILCLSTANKPDEVCNKGQEKGIGPIEVNNIHIIKNESMDTMFRAASEATEEAVLNSIIAGRDGRTGNEGFKMEGFPVQRVKELLAEHRVVI